MTNGNLLIVDDEPLIVKNLKFTLEDYASEIFTAANGLEAIEVLKKETVHCIICDINMPKMNGVDLIKALRAAGNQVPMIFYTGHGNRELMMEVIKYGAFDFLDKPNMEGLEDVISRGLKAGFNRNDLETPATEDAYISEFQLLLSEIDAEKKL